MRRGKPLERKTPLRALPSLHKRTLGKGKLPPVNAKRKAKRAAEGKVYGEYHRWISDEFPCVLAGKDGHRCRGAIKGHHVKSVATGGEDYANEVPMCERAHNKGALSVHTLGVATFAGRWHVSLTALAAEYARLWDAERFAA